MDGAVFIATESHRITSRVLAVGGVEVLLEIGEVVAFQHAKMLKEPCSMFCRNPLREN